MGLNVDENMRNREEKRRMGLKAFGRPRARCGAVFFWKIRPKIKKEKKLKRLAGPGPYRINKKIGRPPVL